VTSVEDAAANVYFMHAPKGGNNRYTDTVTVTDSGKVETPKGKRCRMPQENRNEKIYIFTFLAKARIVTNDDGTATTAVTVPAKKLWSLLTVFLYLSLSLSLGLSLSLFPFPSIIQGNCLAQNAHLIRFCVVPHTQIER